MSTIKAPGNYAVATISLFALKGDTHSSCLDIRKIIVKKFVINRNSGAMPRPRRKNPILDLSDLRDTL